MNWSSTAGSYRSWPIPPARDTSLWGYSHPSPRTAPMTHRGSHDAATRHSSVVHTSSSTPRGLMELVPESTDVLNWLEYQRTRSGDPGETSVVQFATHEGSDSMSVHSLGDLHTSIQLRHEHRRQASKPEQRDQSPLVATAPFACSPSPREPPKLSLNLHNLVVQVDDSDESEFLTDDDDRENESPPDAAPAPSDGVGRSLSSKQVAFISPKSGSIKTPR
eukprot:Sspe_Gene.102503::Locus_78001_Transcript_2_2_Confidence_0.750_Length_744::g.102503::m.102503